MLPAALIMGCVLSPAARAFELYRCALAVHILSLGACRGFRSAAARQTRVEDVRGSAVCALALQIAGALGFVALFPRHWAMAVPALCLNIEHMFYEYLYTMGEGSSAALCRFLTALLTLTGLLLDAGGYAWLTAVTALSALLSTVIATTGGGLKVRLNAQVVRHAPRSMLYGMLYPAACAALSMRPIPFFVGLAVYGLCRTPFRRSAMESRAMNAALSALCLPMIVLMYTCITVVKNAPRTLFQSCGAVILASACAVLAFSGFSLPTFPRRSARRPDRSRPPTRSRR